MKTVERKSNDHRVLRNYLARIAGRSPSRFCSPSLLDLRFALHENAEVTMKIIADLETSGEIIPEVRTIGGKAIHGWIVYPARNNPRASSLVNYRLGFTRADNEFLNSCGITAITENNDTDPTMTAGAVPPVNKTRATVCAAGL